MTTTKNSPTPRHSDAAVEYAVKIKKYIEDGGFTFDARDVAFAYDAGAASREALVGELVEALQGCASLLETIEPEVRGGYSPDGALATARSLLAKMEGR